MRSDGFSLANALANACERLTNEMTTQCMRGELHIKPLPMFHFITYSPATGVIYQKVLNTKLSFVLKRSAEHKNIICAEKGDWNVKQGDWTVVKLHKFEIREGCT
jgi:hypothetical protein